MLKTTEKNSDNNYLLTPDNLPVVMDINQLTVELSSEYKALIIDESGLKLQSKPEGKGELRAAVLISGSDELTCLLYTSYLVFEGGDENNDLFEIWVANPSSAKDEAVMMRLKVHIPYGKKARHEHIIMPSGRCMTGTVYRGESNNIPLGSVSVTAHLQIGKVSLPYQLETKTATDGTFTLRNLPIEDVYKRQVFVHQPFMGGMNVDILHAKKLQFIQMHGLSLIHI